MTRALRAFSTALIAVLLFALAGCGGGHARQAATGSVAPKGWGTPPAHGPAVTATLGRLFTMYDSVTIGQIPAHPFADAGYPAGLYATYAPLRLTWPQAHTVSVAISAAYHADCLDVEPGDAVSSQVVAWVRADERAGFKRPCIYSSYFEFTREVRPALAAGHIARSSIFEWDADYTGTAHIDATFDATQYTDRCLGRNLDCSLVTAAFLAIAQPAYNPAPPKPKPAPKPKPKPKPARWAPDLKKLDPTVRRLHGQRMSERGTVRAWVRLDCQNPVRRPACRSLRAHAGAEKARVRFVASHGPGPQFRKLPRPDWSKGAPSSLGVRNQILQHVLTMH